MNERLREIDAALERLRDIVAHSGSAIDLSYLDHIPRYRRTAQRLTGFVPRGAKVLDVGSHFLHQAVLFSLLGYQVVGIDVPAFAEVPLLAQRAESFGIENRSVARFEDGDFLSGHENTVDFVNFCEIQEHITFNPVRFWRRIHELLKVGGAVYLTTPNSQRLWHVGATIKRAILGQGIGLDVPSIVNTVTYGHHWKEYSAGELRQLFALLSPDFHVEVEFVQRRADEKWRSPKAIVRDVTRKMAYLLPKLREELEVVITLEGRSQWTGGDPAFF